LQREHVARLNVFRPGDSGSLTAHWRINGHVATLHVWTDDAFRELTERPADAQYFPCGVWCALRVDG
jgi:hypothetical protein